jgi:putative transposase
VNKISPSERISNEIKELLIRGITNDPEVESTEEMLSMLLQKGMQKFIQEILEQETKDYLGRGPYERIKEKEGERIYRNGYEDKHIKTTQGKIKVELPQLRNTEHPYRSNFIKQLGNISPDLEKMIREMWVRGLSTRDIEETLRGGDGKLLISRSGVSEITKSLAEEYSNFSNRDLSIFDVVYLFVDGVYESIRLETGIKEAILCSWAILSNGHKIMLHLALGNKESYECWKEFFREMISRGLRYPMMIVSDGAPGLIKAMVECFPESDRQRCIAHKMRNISNRLSEEGRMTVIPKIREVFYQSDKELAMLLAGKVIENFAEKYPSAIKCFQDDLEHSLTFMKYPQGHHDFIRTTNVLERAFEEQRRRTKVIPRFFDETSCITLVFATLIRVSEKWKKIKMTSYDLALLKNLRNLFGWKEDTEGFISKKYAA